MYKPIIRTKLVLMLAKLSGQTSVCGLHNIPKYSTYMHSIYLTEPSI